MSNELETFLHGVTDTMEAEKLAAEDLSCLTEQELALVAFGEEPELLDKLAACGGSTMRPADVAAHYREKGKKKEAGDVDVPGNVSYDGDVNNGESGSPDWPRAAMGVDSAGRRATDSEEKKQDDKATPQHVTPKTSSYFKSASKPAPQKLAKTDGADVQGAAASGLGGAIDVELNPPAAPKLAALAPKLAALSDAKQEKGLGKAVKGLAHSKMDPDQKAALAKGLGKAIKKEKAEADPAKFASGLLGAVEKVAKKEK